MAAYDGCGVGNFCFSFKWTSWNGDSVGKQMEIRPELAFTENNRRELEKGLLGFLQRNLQPSNKGTKLKIRYPGHVLYLSAEKNKWKDPIDIKLPSNFVSEVDVERLLPTCEPLLDDDGTPFKSMSTFHPYERLSSMLEPEMLNEKPILEDLSKENSLGHVLGSYPSSSSTYHSPDLSDSSLLKDSLSIFNKNHGLKNDDSKIIVNETLPPNDITQAQEIPRAKLEDLPVSASSIELSDAEFTDTVDKGQSTLATFSKDDTQENSYIPNVPKEKNDDSMFSISCKDIEDRLQKAREKKGLAYTKGNELSVPKMNDERNRRDFHQLQAIPTSHKVSKMVEQPLKNRYNGNRVNDNIANRKITNQTKSEEYNKVPDAKRFKNCDNGWGF